MPAGKHAFIGLVFINFAGIGALAHAGTGKFAIPPCPEGSTCVGSGTISLTDAGSGNIGTGTGATEAIACQASKDDAAVRLYIGSSRIRDEECIDGAMGGTSFLTATAIIDQCFCDDRGEDWFCVASSTQDWACCKVGS